MFLFLTMKTLKSSSAPFFRIVEKFAIWRLFVNLASAVYKNQKLAVSSVS